MASRRPSWLKTSHPVLAVAEIMVKRTSFARLDPFTRGQTVGMRQAGTPRDMIIESVMKKDGTRLSIRAVDAVLAKKLQTSYKKCVRFASVRSCGRGRAAVEISHETL